MASRLSYELGRVSFIGELLKLSHREMPSASREPSLRCEWMLLVREGGCASPRARTSARGVVSVAGAVTAMLDARALMKRHVDVSPTLRWCECECALGS